MSRQMKVYVDEMPKCCIDCPCNSELYYCNLLHKECPFDSHKERHEDCPLQQLPTDTKWEKLKEWVNERKLNERKKLANGLEYARNTYLIPQAILNKMHELEGEDE